MATNRPNTYTKNDWENKTYRVYLGVLRLAKREITFSTFADHPIVKELEGKLCGAKTPADFQKVSLVLFEYMCRFATKDHTKVSAVKTIASLRMFFNGEWKNLMARPVVNKEPKKPAEPKKDAKKQGKKPAKQVNNKPVVTLKDVPEEVKKQILAEHYKKNHKKSA